MSRRPLFLWTGCIVALYVVGTVGATPITIWVNDFSTLGGVSCPTPDCEPYLYDGGAWVDSDSGQATMDVEMCDLQSEQAYDLSRGDITMELQVEGDYLDPGEFTSVWARFYSRVWNDDTEQWEFSGWRNYHFIVEHTSQLQGFGPGWQVFTLDVDDWDGGSGPFHPDQVYMFRLDGMLWDPPARLGISHCEIVAPECPNDLDGDDDVDLADLAALLSEYGCTPSQSECAIDYDDDGDTDLADLAELLSSYGCGGD